LGIRLQLICNLASGWWCQSELNSECIQAHLYC
jgi:hypothetical protein